MDSVINAIRTADGARHGLDRWHDSVKYVSRLSLHSIYKNHFGGQQSIDSVTLDLTITESHRTRCCTFDGQIIPEAKTMPQCFPMLVSHDDPVYSKYFVRCLNFVRSTTDIDRGCSSSHKPAEQVRFCISFTDSLAVISRHETNNERAKPYPRKEP